jgi:CRP/FNR family cyclic AMP-dependent transcriptional regulator
MECGAAAPLWMEHRVTCTQHCEPSAETADTTVRAQFELLGNVNCRYSGERSVAFPQMTIDTLRQVPLFESLDDEAADELCHLLESLDCRAGAFLFRAGDQGDAMYLIEHGKVRICVHTVDGREVTLTEFGRGDFFGEMALLDGRRSADAVVAEDARLAVLSREHFLSFMRSSPDVALEMLTALANRLRQTDELLRHTATRNVNVEEAARLTFADRAADIIAEFGGSWKFIMAAVIVLNLWILLNAFAAVLFGRQGFDPYPFLFLSVALNMLQIFQAPIILMSQNRQSHKDRLRAEIDYQINLKNELALNEIIERLKALERDYLRLASDKENDERKNGEGITQSE